MSATNGRNLNDPLITDGLTDAYRISWYGYIGPIIRWCLLGVAATLPITIFLPFLMPLVIIIWPIGLMVRILRLRSIRVYANQAGIWRYRGIFPWDKSIAGVRWHNVDEATTKTNFICWATRAYPIWITNRYTKQIEIWVPALHRGDDFVGRINQVIGQQHAGGMLIAPITKNKPAPELSTAVAPVAIE